MVETTKPSLLLERSKAVKSWINEEEVMFANKIREQVNLHLSPHKYALPPQIVLGGPVQPMNSRGRYFGKYTEYDTESQDLFEVTKEYFESESKPPILISRVQLPVTAWIGHRDQVIDAVMVILKSKKPTQIQ